MMDNEFIYRIFKGSVPVKKIMHGFSVVYEWIEGVIEALVSGVPPVILEESTGQAMIDYKIYGNSVQNGTPSPDNPVEVKSVGDKSKNLVDISALVASNTALSGTTTKENSTLTVHNISDASYVYIPNSNSQKGLFDRLKPNTTYRIKYSSRFMEGTSSPSQGRIVFIDSAGTAKLIFYIGRATTVGQIVTLNGTFKTPADLSEWHKILIYGAHGNGSRTEIIDWIVTEETETVEPYEPYGYKIPIEVGGKNLFDVSEWLDTSKYAESNYANSVSVVGNKITISNLANVSIVNPDILKYLKPNTTYYISVKKCTIEEGDKNNTTFRIGLVPKNGVAVDNFYFSYGGNAKFKTPADLSGYGYLCLFASANGVISFDSIQIEEGETVTDYEPYKELITTNIYLDEPLADGEYIDFKNQKFVKADGEMNIALPELKTHRGTSIVSVGTEILPSSVEIQYYKIIN